MAPAKVMRGLLTRNDFDVLGWSPYGKRVSQRWFEFEN